MATIANTKFQHARDGMTSLKTSRHTHEAKRDSTTWCYASPRLENSLQHL